MDQARKLRTEFDGDDPIARLRSRPDAGPVLDGFDKVLRFSPGARAPDSEAPRERAGSLSARDITQALDLVHEAAQSIKAAEERVRESDGRSQALLQRATEELKSAEARVQAAEARARTAETRAQDAEARLREAEGWLRQVFSAISEELPQRR